MMMMIIIINNIKGHVFAQSINIYVRFVNIYTWSTGDPCTPTDDTVT